MSDQKCSYCGELLKHGDNVKAEIITKFVGLKSKVHYALERPSQCTWIAHVRCDDILEDINDQIID